MNLVRLGILLIICYLCVICIVSAENNTSEQIAPGFAWNGTWSNPDYTLYITQNGSGISGSYVPYNLDELDPGLLEGNLSAGGKIFSGIWVETGSNTYTLSDDKMSFTIIGYNDPQASMTGPANYSFNAKRVGEIIDHKNPWTGNWITEKKSYKLTQNGTRMSGMGEPLKDVNDEKGTLSGIVSEDGTTYNGTWVEKGKFTFILADGGSSCNATITNSLDPLALEEFTSFSK